MWHSIKVNIDILQLHVLCGLLEAIEVRNVQSN